MNPAPLNLDRTLLHQPLWLAALLSLIAGTLPTLSLAPFNLWPLGLLGAAVFALCLHQRNARTALALAFCFGLSHYGAGVTWVYVSIHTYGNASAPLAALLTGLFVAFMAAVFALPWWAWGRWFSARPLGLLLGFPLFWLLGEWLRTWLLTGFPWLYLGYAHLDTWLAGWGPVGGVMAISLIVTLSAATLARWVCADLSAERRALWCTSALCALLWLGGGALKPVAWTQLDEEPIRVGMVQPDIPQDIKWDPGFALPTMNLLREMSEELWQYDWLIWPEAAVPVTYHRALPFLDQMSAMAEDTNTGLITGIIFDDPNRRVYYNSVAGFGPAMGIYHKRRLVPFGEYVPLESWLRGLIEFFDLPTSIITRGPEGQQGLDVDGVGIAASICYEIVYPDLVARGARDNQVLLTLSNDAWFADSIGPKQHMQMARMRALETRRYLVRSTNNGISAIVDPRGEIQVQSNQFVAETLAGEVHAAHGNTPFMRWGSIPLVILLIAGLAGLPLAEWRRRRRAG
ncbi:apolipoprotein N-acyltransferase [Marinimicrobium alkaliphilum]|uniref:apolipoprotein N-acyltransferase n=1 Tax=Marinimicrobium alkaliphilum TaxID=2202654 RepID=UPI000DBACBF9|nr:apolipoprotein N-acyltransferase [Marinimicrobium alkaliphilum]